VLLAKEAVVLSDDPPDAALYHLIAVPVAVRLATVGLAVEQNACGLLAAGAAGGV
jgi:hypothetical protein